MIRDLMIGGASVEDMLALWASALREGKRRLRPLFTQERVAASAGQFLDALLGNEPRKTGWMRAEAAGDKGPWRQQALLGRGRWDADALRDIVRDHVVAHLGVVSRMLWKFPGGGLRAFEGSVFQAARSRGIGSMG